MKNGEKNGGEKKGERYRTQETEGNKNNLVIVLLEREETLLHFLS